MKLLGIAAAMGLLLVTTGCSGGAEPQRTIRPDVNIASAKSATQEAELKLVGLIPSDQVDVVDQRNEGSLLSCSDSEYQWAGHTDLALASGVDSKRLTNALDSAARTNGFVVTRDTAIDGYDRLTARSAEGVSLLICAAGDGTRMQLSSFSACFAVPADFVPGLAY